VLGSGLLFSVVKLTHQSILFIPILIMLLGLMLALRVMLLSALVFIFQTQDLWLEVKRKLKNFKEKSPERLKGVKTGVMLYIVLLRHMLGFLIRGWISFINSPDSSQTSLELLLLRI